MQGMYIFSKHNKAIAIIFLLASMLFASCKGGGKTLPEIQTPPPNQEDEKYLSIKIKVINGVNSTNLVSGSILKIYEHDSNEMLFQPILLEGKEIQLQFENNKYYDFIVEGNEIFATSSLKNLKIIRETKEINLFQLKKQLPNRPASLLKLSKFSAIVNGKEIELKNGIMLPSPLTAKIKASVLSNAGAIRQLFRGGFGAKLSFNANPYSVKLKGSPFLSGIEAESFTTIEKDEMWKNDFSFDVAEHNMGNLSEVDFVLICYDVCGNRGEYHTLIKFEGATYKAHEGNDISIKDIACNIKTSYQDMHIYSNEKKNMYYFPNFSFEVEGEYVTEVMGSRLFRRCKKDTYFVQTSEVLYDRAQIGKHIIVDAYGGIETGEEYEYKIRALLKKGSYVDSKPIPVKILKPFSLSLALPKNHSSLSSTPDFSFSISSEHASFAELFSKENADYVLFGLSITSYKGERFPSFLNTFKYWLDDEHLGNKKLEILQNYRFRSLEELQKTNVEFEGKKISDFVDFDFERGIITIKALSLKHTDVLERKVQFNKNVPYYWDICTQDIRQNVATPVAFYREKRTDDMAIVLSANASVITRTAFSGNGAFTISFDDGKTDSPILPHDYIIKVRDDVSLDFLDELNAEIIDQIKVSKERSETYYSIHSKNDIDLIPILLSREGIISAEHDVKMTLIAPECEENAPLFPSKIKELNQSISIPFDDPLLKSSCYSLDITGAYKAYEEFGFGDEKVVAGIIDMGINENHEDFFTLNGDSIIEKINESDSLIDETGHGTHCAGIIAGVGNNHVGIAGTSWKNTKLIPLKMLSTTKDTYKQVLKFVEYIKEQRAKGAIKQKTVPLNMSFGSPRTVNLGLEVIHKALAEGVLPIVASGNNGSHVVNYPAAYPGVIAVGNSNGRDEVDSTSTRGNHLSIVAPGSAIISCGKESEHHYVSNHGTSMAAPFVTGAISYLMSLNPDLTPFQIKTILESSADKIEGKEVFNTKRGFGRINVYKSAKMVKTKDLPENVFFEGRVEISAPLPKPYYTISIYDEKGVCIVVSQTNNSGKIIVMGLLPGNYTAKLLSIDTAKTKAFVVPKNSSSDVFVSF